MNEALKGKTRAEWVEVMNAGTISCGPINTVRDIDTDPHVAASNMIVSIDHPEVGPVRMPASPIGMSATPAQYRKAPPLIGEDTDAVLAKVLGLSSHDIAALRDRGII